MRKVSILPVILSLAVIGGCQSKPERTYQIDPMTGLPNIEGTTFDKFALESPEKLAKYRAIYFAPLDLSQLDIDTRRLDAGDRDWTLSPTEKAKVAGYFADNIMSSFRDSALPLARTPGQDVLVAEIALTKFTPTAPKDDLRSRMARTEIFTYNVGDLEMTGRLKDSVTGAVLGHITDTEEVGDTLHLQKNDRVNNTRKLKLTFNEWTRGLADTLKTLNNR